MTRNGIFLLLALGASAVPHWMGEGKQTEYPQSPNSRRLDIGDPAGCEAACPDAAPIIREDESFSREKLKVFCSPKVMKAEKCMAVTQDCWDPKGEAADFGGPSAAEMDSLLWQALMGCVCKCAGGITDEATFVEVSGLCQGELEKIMQGSSPGLWSHTLKKPPSVSHPACSSGPFNYEPPSVEPPSVVKVAFDIKGISLTDLDSAAEDGLKKDLAKGLAKQTGAPLDKITITLEAASRRLAEGKSRGIKVKADIETDDPDTVERESKKTDTTALVKDSATLQKVVEENPSLSMDDISATEPTVTVEKPKKKKAAEQDDDELKEWVSSPAIIGGVVGGVIILGCVCYVCKKKKQASE